MNIRKWLGLKAAEPVVTPEAESVPRVFMPFDPGHFYSPIVDPATLLDKEARLWPEVPVCVGIDFNDDSQRLHLEAIRQHSHACDYPDQFDATADPPRFSHNNDQFGWLDSRALFGLLNHYKPKNLIEVGGGYSSLLIGDVNARLLDNTINFISIEPYPRDFLAKGFNGLTRLIQQKVEEVPLAVFDVLDDGDILFIDSSHVAKTGSDVNYLLFEILPRLRKGVIIHVHDIYLPFEYPREWVIDENRSWNEQYVLRALLMHSTAFKVVFGSYYAFMKFPAEVASALALPDGQAFGGGSLWLRKVD
jgi:hypothetical protein